MPKLPLHVLRLRLKNELEMCIKELPHKIEPEDPEFQRFPTRIFVTLVNVPGPVVKAGRVTFVRNHRFSIIITDEYPYRKPIVQWLTDIYHPNITTPKEGGHFCSGLLKTEGFNFSLVSFIKSVESLLMNPNPYSPWDTPSCMSAAKYFHEKKKMHEGKTIRPLQVPVQRTQAQPQQRGMHPAQSQGRTPAQPQPPMYAQQRPVSGAPVPRMSPMQQAMRPQPPYGQMPQPSPMPYPQGQQKRGKKRAEEQ